MVRGRTKATVLDTEVDDFVESEMEKRGVKASPTINAIIREYMQIKGEHKEEKKIDVDIKSKEGKVEEKKVDVDRVNESKYEVKIPEIKYEVSNMTEESTDEKIRRFNREKEIDSMLNNINLKASKIDSICEDGKCMKDDISKLKADISELKGIKNDIVDIKKTAVKLEPCPFCNEKSLVPLSSFCSSCGKEIPEWLDDDGNPIENWKRYSQRNKK